MRKSEKAKLTTRRFDGVRSALVDVKTRITIKLPIIAKMPRTKVANAIIECHNGFIGYKKRNFFFFKNYKKIATLELDLQETVSSVC